MRSCLLALCVLLAWSGSGHATPPRTPISLDLALSRPPGLNEWATLAITVESVLDAPGTTVELMLPPGVLAPTTTWTLDLRANTPVSLSAQVFVTRTGNLTLSARALRPAGTGAVWGDMKSIPLTIGSPVSGPSVRGWSASEVPVAAQAQPGDATVLSSSPTPFSFAGAAAAEAPAILPSVAPGRDTAGAAPAPPAAPGSVTLTGAWQVADRSNVNRAIDQQLIEIRHGDGSALSPQVFCFTDSGGSFSCTFANPGTTMRVWVRSWTNFNVPGGTNRLGVFSGTEVTNGCGSDSINCSYPVQTPEVFCADGATCNVGTWIVSEAVTGEPWTGAHWMTQDLIRSWKKLFFDVKHGTGVTAGPGRINYPVPAGHGTHAHVPPADGWISIEPPNQQSGDIVNHEYGHVVMANLWQNFTPNWPTSDCPSPHFINAASGPGCAFSEGFADFWAWYSNQFYDGDSSTANDGGVFNWPGGASTNMETRDGGTYDSGDQVEGNIAAVLGDLFDPQNDGPLAGPADRVSDGIQHIWHTVSSQSDNNFSEWWAAYWFTFGHPPCPALEILHFNSIQYTLAQCTPDLVVSALTNPPAIITPGGTFSATDTTANIGTLSGGASTTRFFLVGPTIQLAGARGIPALNAGSSSSGTVTLTVPAGTTLGTYSLVACADNFGVVAEGNEFNNCRTAASSVVVGRPDLVETAVSSPPASATPGTSFTVTDTAANQGVTAAGASTTRYYLSLDTVKDPGDHLLTGSRAVPALPVGATSTGSAAVGIPAATPLGTYFLLACADDGGAVIEQNEANNCRASATTILVGRPDLVELGVSNPPATATPGTTFSVKDTAKNQGTAASGASTTRYYLSLDLVKDPGDHLLTGSRGVPALAVGATSTGIVTVGVPAATPLGTYFLLACADDLGAVVEQNEANNCVASATTVVVGRPDLVEGGIVNASVAAPGSSFSVTDTATNQGVSAAGASTTRYYLSLNTVKDVSDRLLAGSRAVPALAAGASSTGSVTVTVPVTTPLGTYFLLACADDLGVVTEQNEANNCQAGTTTVLVGRPDLVETTLINPPATAVRGSSFRANDTAANVGSFGAAASTTRYYLSLDTVKDAVDRLLTGTRPVPALAVGATSNGTVTVTVPSTTPLGAYFLLACADDMKAVAEQNENNNCRASTTQVQIVP